MPRTRDQWLAAIGLVVVAAAFNVAIFWSEWAEPCAGISLLTTCAVLALVTIAAADPSWRPRPSAVGFAVLGWTYFLAARWFTRDEGPLPTVAFLHGFGPLHGDDHATPPVVRIVHDAWTLGFGMIGGLLARLLFCGRTADPSTDLADEPDETTVAGWWMKPTLLGGLGALAVAIATWLGWRSDPPFGAEVCYLLIWTMLGVAGLGALFGRGRRRVAWLGATAFGLGYILLAFGPFTSTDLPTNHLLHAILDPGGPRPPNPLTDFEVSTDDEVQRIVRALETKVSLHLLTKTPLDQVLGSVRQSVAAAMGRRLVVLKPPEDYPGARQTLDDLITIDRDNIPAGEALRLCLEPLGLTYLVRPGCLRIVPNTYRPLPFREDPAMIAGHSALALILAALGAIAAPILLPRPRAAAQGRGSSRRWGRDVVVADTFDRTAGGD
jgi:hypothetical protein